MKIYKIFNINIIQNHFCQIIINDDNLVLLGLISKVRLIKRLYTLYIVTLFNF